MLLSTILVISFGFASVSSFGFAIPFSRPGTYLKAVNKLDGVTIEGDLSPTSNNVFVKVKDTTSVTKSGFIIPDSAKERPNEGTVVSAGAGKFHPDTGVKLEMSAEPGTNVLYGKYDGSEMSYNDMNHQMIKDDDILLTYSGSEATLENVQCVKDLVLIKLPREEHKPSGLILAPKKADNKYNYGTVVKVGPGKQASNGVLIPMPVAAGDQVRFKEYGGTLVKLNGEEYLVTHAQSIVAKW